MPLSMTTLAALATLQFNTAVPLGVMPPGLTVNDATGSGPVGTGVTGTTTVADALFTVTVTDFVKAPAALTAVNV
jgi:hypothetical protein